MAEAESLLGVTGRFRRQCAPLDRDAEIHFKKERWEDAFNAYLHVPVFLRQPGCAGAAGGIDGGALSCETRTLQGRRRDVPAHQRNLHRPEIGDTAKKEFLTVTAAK